MEMSDTVRDGVSKRSGESLFFTLENQEQIKVTRLKKTKNAKLRNRHLHKKNGNISDQKSQEKRKRVSRKKKKIAV